MSNNENGREYQHSFDTTLDNANPGKCGQSSALELGPRKKLAVQDPLVHHSCHFGRAIHAFCNVQGLIENRIEHMISDQPEEEFIAEGHKEQLVFLDLLKLVVGLEKHLMREDSSEEEIIHIADMFQKGANRARADNTKGIKSAVIDWITPKGQTLLPHIHHNVKAGCSFNHECTGTLLCPAGLDWSNTEIKSKLMNVQTYVSADQWPIVLYANYQYNIKDPWNGLLRSSLLVNAFKRIFTSPSSINQEPKATHSGNTQIHSMQAITKAFIAYVAMKVYFALMSAQVFSCTDLVTDSE
ncbi:hypothetical protein SERLA73DRAFT_47911 [Serpula lacrymans var. lacrymans S7.3]|uniref:Uncharacterized protein n=1 Tax=Serpula lacrymans var. lacrymans (strain S7.3) TaxID=936435 RepID=F8PM29_SERL3|nr:hypothetical protein SERLA73DRAFT_47911 [Serpula lacrymans var. lacrymans S7.3]